MTNEDLDAARANEARRIWGKMSQALSLITGYRRPPRPRRLDAGGRRSDRSEGVPGDLMGTEWLT